MNRTLKQAKRFEGTVVPPPSYKTALRILLPALFAEGKTLLHNTPKCGAMESLLQWTNRTFGAVLEREGSSLTIHGLGGFASEALPQVLDTGTDGLLFEHLVPLYLRRNATLRCHKSAVPKRVLTTFKLLDSLGFYLKWTEEADEWVVTTTASSPDALHLVLNTADEQTKTTILYAFLHASGESRLVETTPLPEESELLLKKMGAPITAHRKGELLAEEEDPAESELDDELAKRIRKIKAKKEVASGEKPTRTIHVNQCTKLTGATFDLEGDPLCAAPFLLAGLLSGNANVSVHGIAGAASGGLLSILRRMGAPLKTERVKGRNAFDCQIEPVKLTGRRISGELTADLGEQFPFVAVAAAYAQGQTVIRDGDFLRLGSVDLIAVTLRNLKAMGAKVGEIEDGFVIEGAREYDGAELDAGNHPAVAMAFAVAAVKNKGESVLKNAEIIDSVYPDFFHQLESLDATPTTPVLL